MLELITLTIGFILLSGLLALVDAAILSVSRAEIEELVGRGAWGSTALKAVNRRITRAVIVVVIFTNTVNILGPILIGERTVRLFGSTAIGIITALLALGTIVFSEVIPKSLGAHYAPVVSRIFAPFILGAAYVLFPIVWLLERLVNLFKEGKRAIGTEEQIRALARIGHRAGHIRESEGQIIQRAFLLNDKTAADIMTAKGSIVTVSADSTIRGAADQVFRHAYSRYPVVGANADDVRGLVFSRDILTALSDGKDAEIITSIINEVPKVDAKMRADKLLLLLRDKRVHLAIVREGTKTVGLVTLEDVLEELVGEIEDEAD
jgi:putative hemolysin